MQIIDAQVHIWNDGKPSAHQRQKPFTSEDLLQEMDTAGGTGAVVVPPSWDPNGNLPAIEAAKRHPDQLVVFGGMNLSDPESRHAIGRLGETPEMLGFRIMFTTPARREWLLEGRSDWLWREAERANVPLMIHVPDDLKTAATIAERHPGLRLMIDHMGVPPTHPGTDASFAHLPDLVALAAYPNVAVKATGVAGYSSAAYPYRNLHDHLHRVIDAFGPSRVFWGSDFTRMSCTYRQCVTLFTEELPWLSEADRALIMGDAIRDWIGWTANSASQRAAE